MTEKLSDLRGNIRLVLASATDWPDATLDGFIQDAIRFHSNYFPKRWRHTLTLATGTQAYDLPAEHGFKSIISVEYPTGQSPQSFLEEVNEWDAAFQDQEDVYAIIGIADDTAIESHDAAAQIEFAETVVTGETAVIEYLADHAIPAVGDDDAYITVPTFHWEALIAFVEFRAHWELESDEACTVTTVSIVMGQLGQEARLAWNRYKEVLTSLLGASAESGLVRWADTDDTQRRAY